ncbi:hypothetical protein [Thermovibrio ammonificans]|uniref:Lipoprotein n=1 Tax=Thermovibrio ammonificans (strain DSM 15698 / JCM 12110 / HB-1) TaxID=648996 RepID=E8T5E7_THEA1|nr:hypothetical protein [Thermovibrio ammonificans]ADU97601.1 hypothetical protein Theam_1645 [Thermovibrio ammonificans HB-1]
MKKLLIPLAIAAAVTGCAVNQKPPKTTVLTQEQVKAELLGDTVPIYPGFQLVSDKSFIYESGNIKVGRLIFKGDAPVKDIVSYYKATLPEKGWEPVAITIYGDSAQLTYVTPDQFLQIQVKKQFGQTYLIISLGPRGQASAETPPQVLTNQN